MLESAIDYLIDREYEVVKVTDEIIGVSLVLETDYDFDIAWVRDLLPVEEYVMQHKNQFVMISHVDDTPWPVTNLIL